MTYPCEAASADLKESDQVELDRENYSSDVFKMVFLADLQEGTKQPTASIAVADMHSTDRQPLIMPHNSVQSFILRTNADKIPSQVETDLAVKHAQSSHPSNTQARILQPLNIETHGHHHQLSIQARNSEFQNFLTENDRTPNLPEESEQVEPGDDQAGGQISDQQENVNDPVTRTSSGKKKTEFGGPPGFLNELILHFNSSVVCYLDRRCQEAILGQQELDDPANFGHVKLSVCNRVLDLLMERGDNKTVPGKTFFNNVVDVLGMKYPGMFGQDPYVIVNGVKVRKFSTRGTGGINGIKGTANK